MNDSERDVKPTALRQPGLDMAVFCADIGSVKSARFGWAGRRPECAGEMGTEIRDLVTRVAAALAEERPVALGFECPLFVPVSEDPIDLSSARPGEGSRAWSAQAGAAVLAIGVSQVVWILRALRGLAPGLPAFVEWEPFMAAGRGLFLWEAFVSGKAKRDGHAADAEAAVEAFERSLPDPLSVNAIKCGDVHSLIGAALLRTGWSDDLGLLAKPCLVIRATPEAAMEAVGRARPHESSR